MRITAADFKMKRLMPTLNNNVNVHPFMCYYLEKDPSENENNKKEYTFKFVKHSIVVISNDTKHDVHTVKAYKEKALAVLTTEFEIN